MPTGPGGLDSNGIWQFGEDDSEALASDLLNLGMGSVSTAISTLGGVLQVVSTAKTDTFSTTSTSFADVTGLAASITPASTDSRVEVTVSVMWAESTGGSMTALTVADGSNNNLILPASPGLRTPAFMGSFIDGNMQYGAQTVSYTFVHSPATTSSFTYKVRMLVGGAVTAYINRSVPDQDAAGRARGVSTITLKEVAG